jgi:hypothetical protein
MDDREAYEFYANPENLQVSGPPGRPRRPKRTAAKTVRFDPALLERVERLAGAWHLSVSSWIHAAVQREEYRQRVKWLDGHRHELEIVPGSGRACEPRAEGGGLNG